MSSSSKTSSDGNGWWMFFFVIFVLIISLSWLTIPTSQDISGIEISSLSFANGVLVGWADDIAIWLFHSDNLYTKQVAETAFKNAILTGEKTYPIATIIFMMIGTFMSIGGLIAVSLARNAINAEEAFKLGFFAEIGEGIAYNFGYYVTTGINPVNFIEIAITFIVAIIMGFVAMSIQKRYSHH